MGEFWNKKLAVEDNPTQWSVLLAIFFLLAAPCLAAAALIYFYVNEIDTGVLTAVGGLCLWTLLLPLLALFYSVRRSRQARRR